MNYFDAIIIIPILWAAYKGFKKGLIIEVASLVALFLGVWGGAKFSSVSASYLSEMFSISEQVMPLLSFAITFILIVIAVFFVAKMLQKVIKAVSLSTINKIAGSAFGILKFALIIGIVLNIVNNINQEISFMDNEMKESSLLYTPICKIGAMVPGVSEINVTGTVENVVREEASSRLEEAAEEVAPKED